MNGTEEELRGRLESFAKDQQEQERELNRLRQKEGACRKEAEEARARIQRLTGRRGELKAKMEQLVRAWVCACLCLWALCLLFFVFTFLGRRR